MEMIPGEVELTAVCDNRYSHVPHFFRGTFTATQHDGEGLVIGLFVQALLAAILPSQTQHAQGIRSEGSRAVGAGTLLSKTDSKSVATGGVSQVTVLVKRIDCNTKFGFKLTEGKKQALNTFITLKSVTAGSPADKCGKLWPGQKVFAINSLNPASLSQTQIRKLLIGKKVVKLVVEAGGVESADAGLAGLPWNLIFRGYGLTPFDLGRLAGVSRKMRKIAHQVKSLNDIVQARIASGAIDVAGLLHGTTSSTWLPILHAGSEAQKVWINLPVGVIVGPDAGLDWVAANIVAVTGGEELETTVRQARENMTITVSPGQIILRAWFGDPAHKWSAVHGRDVTQQAQDRVNKGQPLVAQRALWHKAGSFGNRRLLVKMNSVMPHTTIATAVESGARFQTIALADSAVTNLGWCKHGVEVVNIRDCENVSDVTPLAEARSVTLQRCFNVVDVSPLFRLQALDLTGCTAVEDVAALGEIPQLCLADCVGVTDVSKLIRVRTLDLSRCVNLRDVSALSSCQSLILAGCRLVSDVAALGGVHTLDISMTSVTDVSSLGSVYSLTARCTEIVDVSALATVKYLDLSHCQRLMDVSSLGSVLSLDIRGTAVTDWSAVAGIPTLTVDTANRK